MLLGQRAMRTGALSFTGIHRSSIHASRLAKLGITPAQDIDPAVIRYYAACAEVVYDVTGRTLAEEILARMLLTGLFISYGLLSGQLFRAKSFLPQVYWFHVRHYLSQFGSDDWQKIFRDVCQQSSEVETNQASIFSFDDWKGQSIAIIEQAE